MVTQATPVSWFSSLRGDAIGGTISAAVAVPLAMGFGMFAFVPLGDEYFAYGAIAGVYAAMIVAVANVALGQRDTTLYAPRVTTTFILGGLLYQLVHSDAALMRSGDHNVILLAFYAIILLGGVFQALFGFVRLGTLLRYTPQPVMAGFQNAAAALLFLVQLGNVCGLERNVPFMHIGSHLQEIKPLSLVVAVATFVATWQARRFLPKAPPLLVGLATGSVLYFALVAVGFGALLGSQIGSSIATPALHVDLGSVVGSTDFLTLAPTIVGGALAVAVVSALDALLCAKLVASKTEAKTDGNRMLVRLGIGNVLSAAAGGITSGLNIGASLANRAFGAKTALSVIVNAAVLFAVVMAAFPIVSHLPRAVLSAAIMVIAVQHFDRWSVDLVRRIWTDGAHHRALTLLDVAVVVLVAVLAVTIHIVAAVFLGIVIATAVFVVRMSRSNIRRKYRCHTIHSRRARTLREAEFLESNGRKILVLELQGPLFFGTAETLAGEIDSLRVTGIRSVILDMRRMTEVDATGAQILAEIAAALVRDDQRLGLVLARKGEATVRIFESGVVEVIGSEALFGDTDRAIEWAEDDLLRGSAIAVDDEISLSEVEMLRALTEDEMVMIASRVRRVAYPRGREIFHEGDPGDELFIVAKGRASAYLRHSDGVQIRLATFAHGTLFGELAFLEATRSATVITDEDVECWVLDTTTFNELCQTAPVVAIKLLAAIGRGLSLRLRQANKTIDQLDR